MALLHLNFYSRYLSGNSDVSVILPDLPHGNEPKKYYSEGKKFKVLWLLHGTYGDFSDWIRKSRVELYAAEKGIAVVMFSAQNTNFADWGSFAMGYRPYTYLLEELMPLVYSWLPVSDRREDNFIAGLSMGGRGTCVFAFSHPEKFAGAYVMSSAPAELKEPDTAAPSGIREMNLINNFGGMEKYKASVLNIWERAKQLAREKADLPAMYFACGDQDPVAYENFLKFRDLAAETGFPAAFFEVPGYAHEWRFWDLCLQDAMDRFLPEKGRTPVFDSMAK